MRPAAVVVLLLLLGGCSAGPVVRAVSAGPEAVAYEIAADGQEAATRQAKLYCANLGRDAVLEEVKPEGEGLSIARYQCR